MGAGKLKIKENSSFLVGGALEYKRVAKIVARKFGNDFG